MKIKDGLTESAKWARYNKKWEKKRQWEKWFAWYPVVIGITGYGMDERKILLWLEWVWRKRDGEFIPYAYKEFTNEADARIKD